MGRPLYLWEHLPFPLPKNCIHPLLEPGPVPEAREKNISFEDRDLMRWCMES